MLSLQVVELQRCSVPSSSDRRIFSRERASADRSSNPLQNSAVHGLGTPSAMSPHHSPVEEHQGYPYHLQQQPYGASTSNGHGSHLGAAPPGGHYDPRHEAAYRNQQQQQQQTYAEVPTVPLGRTRCYWCILSPKLEFVFLDPILHTHLGQESKAFIGTNLLDYVHPDEQAALAQDLMPKVGDAGGVEGSGVFGSITR